MNNKIPDIEEGDLGDPGAGVRAQAVDKNGNLLQDFSISETDNAIHVMSAPSPGATSSLTISEYIVGMAEESFGLRSVAWLIKEFRYENRIRFSKKYSVSIC